MANIADVEASQARQAEEIARQKQQIIVKFGKDLGLALFEYTQGEIDSQAFAETLANIIRYGSPQKLAIVIKAILEIIEIRTQTLSGQIDEVDERNAVY